MLRIYSSALVIVSVALFYSQLPIYLYVIHDAPYKPVHFMLLLAAASIPLLPRALLWPSWFFVSTGFWILGFAVLTGLWFLFGPQNYEVLEGLWLVFAALSFLSFMLLLLATRHRMQLARQTILVVVVLSVVANLFEYFVPFVFVPLDSVWSNPGRMAGLYINANESGFALVMGLILTIGVLKDRLRPYYVLLVGVGTAITFSRAAMLSFMLTTFILLYLGEIKLRHFALPALAGVLVLSVVLPFTAQSVSTSENVGWENVAERLQWFLSPGDTRDIAEQERLYLIEKGWQALSSAPLTGRGLGFVEGWSERTGTHNMYLQLMISYGVLGIFVLPLMVFSAVIPFRKTNRPLAVPYAVFLLFWGFFSHNLMSAYTALIATAIVATATRYRPNSIHFDHASPAD